MQLRRTRIKNMKTKILLLGTAITAFTFSTFASDVLLTPRQKDNQTKVATSSISTQGGTVTYVTPDSPVLLTPRAADNQIKVVKGTAQAGSAKTVKCQAIGSPKYQDMLGSSARTSCCSLTIAQCPTMDKCQK